MRFEVCHPDQWNVPGTKNFALQALIEAYFLMKEGWVDGDSQPAPAREVMRRVADHPYGALLEEWLELAHGRKVAITEAEYERLERLLREGAGERDVTSIGYDTEGWYKTYRSQFGAFRAAAERAIISVRLEDEENNPRQEDDWEKAHFSKATIVFRVAEPGWLAHRLPGMRWETAIFDFTGWD